MTSNQIDQVTEVTVVQNGKIIKLTIETKAGESLDIEFDKESLRKHIGGLTDLAIRAARQRTGDKPVPFSVPTSTELDYLPVTDIAMAMTQNRHLALVLRLFDFDLNYMLELTQMRSIANSFSQAVDALEADESNPN